MIFFFLVPFIIFRNFGEIGLWWVVELEQIGGLHSIIRWFKLILRVFIIFRNFG